MAVITVSQLNNYIKRCFDNNSNLKDVWVKGEISNFKLHYSGHIYMTVKDETSAVKAVMFKSYASHLKFVPDNGMKILAFGRVSVYERDGAYQLYVENIIPDGKGELYAAYEQLKNKLESEGIFSPEHKKELPYMPQTIGVVTSPTGAAVRDIIQILKRRYPIAEVILYPALVQGVGASKTIIEGIKALEVLNTDVIIIGRGGGSIEDLWAFNDEELARTIYSCKIPIVSAVGHETDFTIADFAADVRAATPSAAAEITVPDIADIKSYLKTCKNRLENSLIKVTELKKQQLNNLLSRDLNKILNRYLTAMRENINILTDELADAYTDCIGEKSHKLKTITTALYALSPLNVLERGYSIVSNNNKPVSSIKHVHTDDLLSVTVTDGSFYTKVVNTEKEN